MGKKGYGADPAKAWLMGIEGADDFAYAARYSGIAYEPEEPFPHITLSSGTDGSINHAYQEPVPDGASGKKDGGGRQRSRGKRKPPKQGLELIETCPNCGHRLA